MSDTSIEIINKIPLDDQHEKKKCATAHSNGFSSNFSSSDSDSSSDSSDASSDSDDDSSSSGSIGLRSPEKEGKVADPDYKDSDISSNEEDNEVVCVRKKSKKWGSGSNFCSSEMGMDNQKNRNVNKRRSSGRITSNVERVGGVRDDEGVTLKKKKISKERASVRLVLRIVYDYDIVYLLCLCVDV